MSVSIDVAHYQASRCLSRSDPAHDIDTGGRSEHAPDGPWHEEWEACASYTMPSAQLSAAPSGLWDATVYFRGDD